MPPSAAVVAAAAPATTTAAVVADALVFAYAGGAPPALDGLSVVVPQGERFALLGPNGAGKSTLLSIVNGLRAPQRGGLRLFGAPPGASARRSVGVVFQENCLDPLMTVRETLVLQGRLFGMGGAPLRERIDAMLTTVGLTDRAGQPAGELSGGLKRRLELARAMLAEPRLLLLDEPTVGLDPDSRRRLWEHLLAINAAGTTLLLATNDVAEADRFATTVAFIERGRVVAQGAPIDLKRGLRRDAVWVDAPDLPGSLVEVVAALPGVGRVSGAPPSLHVTVDDAATFVPELFRIAQGSVRAVRIEESTLEDAYFELAGTTISRHDGEAHE